MIAKKILIVEDDRDIRRNVKALLESEGYDVSVAENGHVALEVLAAMQALPSMILLDLTMPVMDGFEFRARQVATARIAAIPVAIMTADGNVEEKKQRIRAAAALRKPADIDEILDVVQRLA